jgi:hypothetical protein
MDDVDGMKIVFLLFTHVNTAALPELQRMNGTFSSLFFLSYEVSG